MLFCMFLSWEASQRSHVQEMILKNINSYTLNFPVKSLSNSLVNSNTLKNCKLLSLQCFDFS